MKKSGIITIVVCVVLAAGFFFTTQTFFRAENEESTIIEEGVYIGGVSVGGMTMQEATDAVNAHVEEWKTQTITLVGPKGSIELTLGEMGITADVETAVEHASGTAKSGNLITRFMLLKDLESENAFIDLTVSIDKQATGNLIYDKLDELNITAVDCGLKKEGDQFIFVPGQSGEEIDIVTSVNALSELMKTDGQDGTIEYTEFALTSALVEPRGSEEELAMVKDLLGSYSTDFSSSNSGRKKNVTTGCEKLNGTLLYPGDVLSVYAITSPYTTENGYGMGGAYSNGELIESIGGGICQVSTTLYNAVIRAELKITQRNSHSMTVAYVEVSEDAAIAGTYKDLRFRNDYDYPIYIEGYCNKGILTFNIYGCETRDANRTIRFENEILTTDDPETEYTVSSSKAVGYYSVTRSKHVGYTAKLWKIITIDGVDTERVQLNRSTYKSSCMKVTIGTAGATDEQMALINAALATKDDDYIKQVIEGINNPTPEPEPTPEPTPEPEPEVPDSEPPSSSEETPGDNSEENPDNNSEENSEEANNSESVPEETPSGEESGAV